MGKNRRTSSKSILETLAAELWVREVKEVLENKYADGNGVAMVGEDHRRKESQFQAIMTKAKIEDLMKNNCAAIEERDDSSNNISDLTKSKSITFLRETRSGGEDPGNRCVKDHLRAITAGIDPYYREKAAAKPGEWSGYFGDQEACTEKSVEVRGLWEC